MALMKKSAISAEARSQSRSLDELLLAFNDGDAGQRKRAAHELAAFPEAARPLSEELRSEEDAAVSATILTALIKIGTADVVANLVPYLHSENARLRNDVIVALQQMHEAVVPFMSSLLGDDDHDIRIFAINILAGVRDARVPPLLLRVIEHEPHINVWAAAIDALSEIGTTDMVPAIEASARRFDNDYGRFAANFAIQRILG
ncbi:MAG TPA: HEAT repeat domain-containing protein [Methylophilaceae bacterium]|nr:HEAT repeat domain-containing protein [Methylophilaceae bacterium]